MNCVLKATRSPHCRSFKFKRAKGCQRYPEAKADATGKSFKGTTANGTVKGFVDAHLHITSDMRAGGRVIDGRAFAPFGVTRALGGDAKNHGPDGSLDVTGNLLRSGTPFGTHARRHSAGPRGDKAMRLLFRSAQAYVDTWSAAYKHG